MAGRAQAVERCLPATTHARQHKDAGACPGGQNEGSQAWNAW
jgi:hypothetical protein